MTPVEIVHVRVRPFTAGPTSAGSKVHCPVNLGVAEALGLPPEQVSTNNHTVRLPDGRLGLLPSVARSWIAAHDRGESMWPLDFALQITGRVA